MCCYLWLKGKNSESKSQQSWACNVEKKCCYLWLKGKNSESKSQPLGYNSYIISAVISGSKVKILKVNHNRLTCASLSVLSCYLWLKGKNSESKSQHVATHFRVSRAVISGSKVKILKVNHNPINKDSIGLSLLSLAQR